MTVESAVPVLYGILVMAAMALWPMMARSRIRLANIAMATVLAGPLVAACLVFPHLSVTWSSNPYGPPDATGLLFILAGAIVVGAFVALPASVIGSAVMLRISDRILWARRPAAWALAGCLMTVTALLCAGEFFADPLTSMALIVTGTCCALICRRRVSFGPLPA
jgi:hypothetical protein